MGEKRLKSNQDDDLVAQLIDEIGGNKLTISFTNPKAPIFLKKNGRGRISSITFNKPATVVPSSIFHFPSLERLFLKIKPKDSVELQKFVSGNLKEFQLELVNKGKHVNGLENLKSGNNLEFVKIKNIFKLKSSNLPPAKKTVIQECTLELNSPIISEWVILDNSTIQGSKNSKKELDSRNCKGLRIINTRFMLKQPLSKLFSGVRSLIIANSEFSYKKLELELLPLNQLIIENTEIDPPKSLAHTNLENLSLCNLNWKRLPLLPRSIKSIVLKDLPDVKLFESISSDVKLHYENVKVKSQNDLLKRLNGIISINTSKLVCYDVIKYWLKFIDSCLYSSANRSLTINNKMHFLRRDLRFKEERKPSWDVSPMPGEFIITPIKNKRYHYIMFVFLDFDTQIWPVAKIEFKTQDIKPLINGLKAKDFYVVEDEEFNI